MQRRTLLAVGGLTLGALSLGIALLSAESEEEKMRRLLNELALAVNFDSPIENPLLYGTRLADRFEELLAEPVALDVPEAGGFPASPRPLALAATPLLSRFGAFEVEFTNVRVESLEPPRLRALVKSRIVVQGEPRRDERDVDVELEKSGRSYRAKSITVHSE